MLTYEISWKYVKWEPSCSLRTDRQTNRHDEADSRFSQFCERAYEKPVIISRGKQMRSLLLLDGINSECVSLVRCDVVLRDNMDAVLRFRFEVHIKYGIQFRLVETNL